MHPLWSPGDLMLIADHINLLGANLWWGRTTTASGPGSDMSEAYDAGLRAWRAPWRWSGLKLREACTSPSRADLETRAEYRMLRAHGARRRGNEHVPEVITAVHTGMRVLGLSIITDQCLPDALAPASVEQIIAVARAAEARARRRGGGVLERRN